MKIINQKSTSVFFSSCFYVSFQLFANILSTKIVLLPLINLSVDGGTIIYPLTFTLRDFVHKTGAASARQPVVLAGLLNLVMVGLLVGGKIRLIRLGLIKMLRGDSCRNSELFWPVLFRKYSLSWLIRNF